MSVYALSEFVSPFCPRFSRVQMVSRKLLLPFLQPLIQFPYTITTNLRQTGLRVNVNILTRRATGTVDACLRDKQMQNAPRVHECVGRYTFTDVYVSPNSTRGIIEIVQLIGFIQLHDRISSPLYD